MNADDYIRTLRTHYVDEYIPSGGSCVKFLVGSPSDLAIVKSQLLSLNDKRFLASSATANAGVLHPLSEAFFQIARGVDWTALARQFLIELLLGAGWEELPSSLSIESLARQSGYNQMQVEGEINRLLASQLYKRDGLLPEFRHCMATLIWGIVFPGDYSRSDSTRIALEWLRGEIRHIHHCKPLHIYKKITITNARDALVSLCAIAKQVGFQGTMLVIDFSAYVTQVPGGRRYTPTHVTQFYQALRQFIDSVDALESTMLFFMTTPDFIGDSRLSYNNYQALRLRLTNEAFAVGTENPLAPLIEVNA